MEMCQVVMDLQMVRLHLMKTTMRRDWNLYLKCLFSLLKIIEMSTW